VKAFTQHATLFILHNSVVSPLNHAAVSAYASLCKFLIIVAGAAVAHLVNDRHIKTPTCTQAVGMIDTLCHRFSIIIFFTFISVFKHYTCCIDIII